MELVLLFLFGCVQTPHSNYFLLPLSACPDHVGTRSESVLGWGNTISLPVSVFLFEENAFTEARMVLQVSWGPKTAFVGHVGAETISKLHVRRWFIKAKRVSCSYRTFLTLKGQNLNIFFLCLGRNTNTLSYIAVNYIGIQ